MAKVLTPKWQKKRKNFTQWEQAKVTIERKREERFEKMDRAITNNILQAKNRSEQLNYWMSVYRRMEWEKDTIFADMVKKRLKELKQYIPSERKR